MLRFGRALLLVFTIAMVAVVADPAATEAEVERSLEDRPDTRPGPQFHIVYAVPHDGTDRQLDVDGTLSGIVAASQKWFAAEWNGSGGLRIDRTATDFDITFLELPQDEADLQRGESIAVLEAVRDALTERASDNPDKKYIVFYDGAGPFKYAGQAYLEGQFGVVLLQCAPWLTLGPISGDLEWPADTFVHESLHMLGARHVFAPKDDIMNPTNSSGPKKLDPERNDYWGASRFGNEDISGSPYLDPFVPGWATHTVTMPHLARN